MIVMALGQLSTENIILRIVLTSMLEFLSFCLFGFVGTLTPFLRRSNEKTFNPFKTAVSGCSRAADTRIEVLLWLHSYYSKRQG